MAAKQFWKWLNSSGAEVGEITANGTYTLAAYQPEIRSDVQSLITILKGSGADPIGATVSVGLRSIPGITPEPISGGSIVLPSLASTQISIPAYFYPKGEICITVSGYVAPMKVGVIQ